MECENSQEKEKERNHIATLAERLESIIFQSSLSGELCAMPFSLSGIFTHKKKSKIPLISSPLETEPLAAEPVQSDRDAAKTSSPSKSINTVVPINVAKKVPRHRRNRSEYSEDSTFSGWSAKSPRTNSTWSASTNPSINGRIVQELSPTSYVSQSTEVTVSSRRGSLSANEQLATSVHISAEGSISNQTSNAPAKSSPVSEFAELSAPRSRLKQIASLPVMRDDVEMSPSKWPAIDRSLDSWQPPNEWSAPPTDQNPMSLSTPSRSSSQRFMEKRVPIVSSELTQLRRAIRRMDAAPPKIVLQRLEEECTEEVDASVYRELELEKQLWMLTALRNLKNRKLLEKLALKALNKVGPFTKVLSLYENQACASFLAALTPHPEIHHLAISPLSSESYPNVYPLGIPGPTSTLPYASSIFSSIHAISIPSLVPTSSLPDILKDCQRILITGGCLHLTLLDPVPAVSTLGPRLRIWLENHLLHNLERQSRCVQPARLIPILLTDARLCGNGSTISAFRFYASSNRDITTRSISSAENEESATMKQKVRTQIGRMLWKEIWGGYVEGGRWWWDDAEIVEECERLKTAWDFSIIEAVKE